MITEEHMIWIGVSQCPGIGPKRFQQLELLLAERQLHIADLWRLSSQKLSKFHFFDPFREQFLAHRASFELKKLQQELEKKQVQVVTKQDEAYPSLLKEIPDSPPVLFVQGYLRAKLHFPIAVVGTRKVTSYGRMVTRKLTSDLIAHDAEIISGLMYGVDTIGHQTAIECEGYTIGVLGYGFDHAYPASHKKFKAVMIESGNCLMSEYLPWVEANVGLFPQRNRIVAGMSKGVLVTEAAANSGSKITAQCAADYGRDVFAVPGPITSPYAEGTKQLINTGAKLVSSVSDILEDYHSTISSKGTANIRAILEQAENESESIILELLLQQSLDSDEILQQSERESQEVLPLLSMLEMRGLIGIEKGKYFVKF